MIEASALLMAFALGVAGGALGVMVGLRTLTTFARDGKPKSIEVCAELARAFEDAATQGQKRRAP